VHISVHLCAVDTLTTGMALPEMLKVDFIKNGANEPLWPAALEPPQATAIECEISYVPS
jgi:hypothetical protein